MQDAIDIHQMPVWDGEHACWFVKKTDHYRVDIFEMITNYRIVVSQRDDYRTWEKAWCYFGRTPGTFLRAITAAQAFDPETEDHPAAYDKALL